MLPATSSASKRYWHSDTRAVEPVGSRPVVTAFRPTAQAVRPGTSSFCGRRGSGQQATDAERAAAYDWHRRFAELLEQRGHRIIGGAEPTPSREARVIRGDLDAGTVPDHLRGASRAHRAQRPYRRTVRPGSAAWTVTSDELYVGRAAQTNALSPVIARPTISVLISRVPS